jgi:hypothetical protein
MPQRHVSRLIALLALLLAVGACDSTATTTTTTPPSDPACPVTLPTPGDFVPPAPYPATYPSQDFVWYGEAGLWTVLDPDGGYQPRKSVWWSEQFPGGDVEERPALHVTHRRIAEPDVPIIDNEGNATNAYTVDDGWFMIATIDPDEPGCWQVEASYKGATLSYVYLVPEADE